MDSWSEISELRVDAKNDENHTIIAAFSEVSPPRVEQDIVELDHLWTWTWHGVDLFGNGLGAIGYFSCG